MANHDEDEVYWNDSASKKVHKHIFDEDDDDMKKFAASGRKDLFLDEEDNDSLGCYAEVSPTNPEPEAAAVQSSESLPSVKYQRAGSARTHATGSFSQDKPAQPAAEAWAETSHAKASPVLSRDDSRGHRRTPSSISDVVAATVREPTRSDIAKLETQVKRLKIQLENQCVGSLAAEETIKRMLCGKPYLLESYRKLEDKKYLLRCALGTHDGNTINAVIMFLKQTLTQSLFQNTLIEMGAALQYVSYLRDTDAVIEAEDIVSMIGRSEEAAMTRYRYAVRASRLENKVQYLKNCLKSHFELDPSLASDRVHIESQISLLEVQQIIEKADSDLEAQGRHPIMRTHKRRGTLPNQPVLTTLYYCCLYHYDQGPSNFASPNFLKQKFNISDVQLQWIATSALAKIHRWTQLEQIFAGKKWYGAATMFSAIGFHNVVKILSKAKTTPDILNKYCSLISDEDERLRIAFKYKCNSAAIDTLIAMKDRTQLLQLRRTLSPGSSDSQKADNALRNSEMMSKCESTIKE